MTAGVAWGLVGGIGLAMSWSWWLARHITLEQRMTLGGGPATRRISRAAQYTPWATVERLLAPVMRDGMRAVERWGSPTQELRHRLERAGSRMTVEQFRAEQVVWSAVALVMTVFASVVLGLTRGASPASLVVLVVVSTLAAPVAREALLTRAIAAREDILIQELPTAAELLALAVSAGESAHNALDRVSRVAHGELATELQRVMAETRSGTPLQEALEALGRRSGIPALRRFADAVATAVERGTPLAVVLRAQAQDVRAEGKRSLMEKGGKKEIAMMVPVVFLILPVTVVFAVFPGMVAIQLGI